MKNPNSLSIIQAANAMRAGELTTVELITACLNRIDSRESTVQAWVHLDRDGALATARECDDDAARGDWRGPLHGIPVGVKDIYDVAGMPTRGGTEAYVMREAEHDAASVARLRHAGAIILGKTVTTAYATGDAGPTTNPWDSSRTPGGSSSGSGAAVGDRMCLAALGTQTAGSVIRPCSYNGAAGMKPGHNRISVEGIIALSWRLDHVGMLTRDVDDAALLWQVMRDDHDWRDDADDKEQLPAVDSARPIRLWRMRGLFDEHASATMAALMDNQCELLKKRGVEIIERELPAGFDKILDHHKVIMSAEAAAAHADNFSARGELYPPVITEHIRHGQTISATDYLAARQHRREMIDVMNNELIDVDGAITPAAADAAPVGLTHTGDRTFNAPSSYLGMPVATWPAALDDNNMPLGLQIMGGSGSEDELLRVASWCETLADFDKAPL